MDSNFRKQVKSLGRSLAIFGVLIALVIGGVLYIMNNPDALRQKESYSRVTKEANHIALDSTTIAESGFINDDGVSQVIQNCTQCHSAKLVTQNRMSKDGWESTITWMQETQNLWDLGANQEKIIGYLAKNYGPTSKGRRQNLTQVNWYELE